MVIPQACQQGRWVLQRCWIRTWCSHDRADKRALACCACCSSAAARVGAVPHRILQPSPRQAIRPTFLRLVVTIKPPPFTSAGRSGAEAEAPACAWLHCRLRRDAGHDAWGTAPTGLLLDMRGPWRQQCARQPCLPPCTCGKAASSRGGDWPVCKHSALLTMHSLQAHPCHSCIRTSMSAGVGLPKRREERPLGSWPTRAAAARTAAAALPVLPVRRGQATWLIGPIKLPLRHVTAACSDMWAPPTREDGRRAPFAETPRAAESGS